MCHRLDRDCVGGMSGKAVSLYQIQSVLSGESIGLCVGDIDQLSGLESMIQL